MSPKKLNQQRATFFKLACRNKFFQFYISDKLQLDFGTFDNLIFIKRISFSELLYNLDLSVSKSFQVGL
ncbi:hypothetical protein LEP1GSC170_4352 [Leptospira interrogans serovar Bataviae str. HAI135]|nr:hypothetical protein LEP1GSC072_0494 [Leptospira noguchii str. Bonito]EMO29058.1 hypothetical protein LEP1GSC170_4352 [Leptospira interrogans serovar Bataviae str. HAI135]